MGHGSRLFHLLAALVIVVLGLAAYSNTLQVPFVFDDQANISDNAALRWTSLNWSNLVRTARESHSSSRPVANISFALNYYADGYDVWGYHVVNTAIHLLNAILVYLLALATFRRIPLPTDRKLRPSIEHWMALAAALIFVSHPIQTQSVTYTVQRMTSLAVLFYLFALLLYIYGRLASSRRHRWTYWGGCFLCWGLALGSKQIAATLPLIILLYEWYFFQDLSRERLKKIAPIALGAIVILAALTWIFMGDSPFQRLAIGYANRDFTLGERLLTQPRVVMFYVSLLLFPHPTRLNLNHFVETSQSFIEPMTTLFSFLGIFGLLGLAIFLAPRYRLASFCLLWFLINLVIESSFIALEMVYEHRLYLPMVGFALLAAWLIFTVVGRWPRWGIGLMAGICLLLAIGTYQRNETWKDKVSLWRDVVSKSPQDGRAHNNLANALQQHGHYEQAVTHYKLSLRWNPKYAPAHNNWGRMLGIHGHFEEAIEHFQRAVLLNPNYVEAHINWGNASHGQGRSEEALEIYQKAVQLRPDNADAHYNWGNALQALGRFDEAVFHFQKTESLNPAHPLLHITWGNCLAQQELLGEAAMHYRRALRIHPDSLAARQGLHQIERQLRQTAPPK